MNLTSQTHKVIAFISLIILSYLQFSLIYTTYELKNRQYFLKESQLIKHDYEGSIPNDKLYPGGQKTIDSIIYRNLASLEYAYYHQPASFELLKQKICDTIITRLRLNSKMDTFFNTILKRNNLQHINYLLVISNLGITFNGIDYISLYRPQKEKISYLDGDIQNEKGIIIDGLLKNPTGQNQISALTVSAYTPGSYQIGFALYADQDNRKTMVLKSMSFTLFLSISFIVMVISIYYFTYRNWSRQKKLSDIKSDFLNNITHEFNTPITTILVANTSIQNKEIMDDKLKVYQLTDVIKRQAHRLQALVNQALDISQINKGMMEKEIYDMSSLLEEVINDYKLKITGNVSIIYNFEHIHCLVLLNRFLLTTMLYNIFDNALKYNIQTLKEIKITMIQNEERLSLCIEDNGVGMNKKLMKSVFDKFYRGKNEIKARGLGLGLFYVKQTIEAHDWQLNLMSELNHGSKFCIVMPVKQEKYY